ncbi:MAG: 1-deoxy-D-xylulose-5-phosphate synthase [Chlorobi bacterium]|nr:1-deoxy-D-xylulose-5-phosphate synthase [Chlorobiota bacterium]
MKTKIMYIEHKGGNLTGEARIGKVNFSKTGKSIHYNGKTFQTLNGRGFKANYFDTETGEHYWISGCKKDGSDRLYGERLPIYIDEDIREEYWNEIRNLPSCKEIKIINEK